MYFKHPTHLQTLGLALLSHFSCPSAVSLCTQPCSLMAFTYANYDRLAHASSDSVWFIIARTPVRTVGFKDTSWIECRLFLGPFLRTNSRIYWWMRPFLLSGASTDLIVLIFCRHAIKFILVYLTFYRLCRTFLDCALYNYMFKECFTCKIPFVCQLVIMLPYTCTHARA